MKLLVIGDVHWSTYSSIVRSRGNNFSKRLENLITSMQFVESIADKYKCDEEIFLGDFFDKPDLTAEEISALSEIEWSHYPRIRHFIVGNHESGIASLVYNSTKSLQFKNNNIVDAPTIYPLDENTELLFLPYITEDNREPLENYLISRNHNKKLIIFSHNDIKDFQMGMFLSKTGFAIDDIENNCSLYVNGHLHNGGWVSQKILNLGNLTGQNFSEDAFKYEHHVAIIDTDAGTIDFIENPYAMNFYKIEINHEPDLLKLTKIKKNAVLSIKCSEIFEPYVRDMLKDKDIVECKITVTRPVTATAESELKFECVDHLKQFKDFVMEKEGADFSMIFAEELMEVCK